MEIDINTLALVLSLSNLLQVIALFTQWRMDKTRPGLGWWTLGIATIALGFVAIYLRAVPQVSLLAIVANNLLFAYGHEFLYIGVLRFFNRHERRGFLGVLSVVYPFVTIYLTYINANLIVRRMVFFTILATLALLTARALVIYKLRATAASAHLLATMFLTHGSVLFLAIFLMLSTTSNAGVQAASPEQVTVMVDGLIMTTLWTLGFILLVSQRSNAESREAKEQRELIFNNSPDAVAITHLSDGRFVEINDGFTALFGYTRADVMESSTIQLKLWKHPEDRQKLVAMLNAQGHGANLEVVFQHKDGSELVCNLSARRLTLNGTPHVITVTHDLTERKRLEDKLRQQATTDELTGAMNRRYFLELLQSELTRAIRLQHPLVIAVIDLDHFKQINDTYGHAAGDAVLRAFAQTCRQHSRDIDLFARFGGDEFALLLPGANCDQAATVLERIRRAITVPINLGGQPIAVTISVGLTSLSNTNDSADTLMSRADHALYQAKAAGRNRVVVE